MSDLPKGTPCYALLWEGVIGSFYKIDAFLNIVKLADVMPEPGHRYALLYGLADPTFDKSVAEFSRFSDAGKLMALASFSRLGLHRAKKEGRWSGKAPIGYSNRIAVTGDKYIAPHDPEATIIKRAFESVAAGIYTTNHIYQQSVNDGLKCSRSNFWLLLRNPVYSGRILIHEFNQEKQQIVKGAHEKVVSISLFEQVQNILNSKANIRKPKAVPPDNFPLRGFLLCPLCGRTLTGSGSKGQYKRYYYYHCSNRCQFRIRADQLNHDVESVFESLRPKEPFLKLYHKIVEDFYSELFQKQQVSQRRITKDIENATERTIRAKDLLYHGDVDFDDYEAIKRICTQKIDESCKELQSLSIASVGIKEKVNLCVSLLSNINKLYSSLNMLDKRKLIHLFVPEKIAVKTKQFQLCSIEAIHTIFGLKGAHYHTISTDNLEMEVSSAQVAQYLKILQPKRSSINQEEKLNIIRFLREFASFSIIHQNQGSVYF